MNIRVSDATRDELRDDVQNIFENAQHSAQALTQALTTAEKQIVEKLEELKVQQNPLRLEF
jgi:hypothetical protein